MSQQSSPDIDPVTGLPWPVDLRGRPMRPDDPFLPVLRQRGRWARGARNLDLPLRLARGVGRHMPNDPSDVAAMEMWLGQTGYYDLERREGPTGYGSPTVDDAILRFQKDHNLTADGWAGPGGETEQALRRSVGLTSAPEPSAASPRHIQNRRTLLDVEPHIELAYSDPRNLPPNRPASPLLPPAGGGGAAPRQVPAPRQTPTPEPSAPQVAPQPLPNRPLVVPVPAVPPDVPQDRTEGGIADYLTRGIDITMEKLGWGPRGDARTQAKNKVVARECKAVIEEEFLAGYGGEHSAGAWQGGDGKYLPEEVVKRSGNSSLLGSVRPDLTWKITTPDGQTETVRLNTVDTKGDGNPTGRERRALERLRHYLKNDLADWMAKGDDDPDSPEFAMRARAKCREIFGKYVRVGSGG